MATSIGERMADEENDEIFKYSTTTEIPATIMPGEIKEIPKNFFFSILLVLKIIIKIIISALAMYGGYHAYQVFQIWRRCRMWIRLMDQWLP